ncbi:sensor histidine kinase [Kolteria novifilia]
MLVPLGALLAFFVYHLASRQGEHYIDELDHVEDTQPSLIANQLGPLKEADLKSDLKQLQRENPGYQFAVFRGDEVLASTISLAPRDLTVIRVIPTVSPGEPGRRWAGHIGTGTQKWYCLTKCRVPTWPADTRLLSLYSYNYAVMLNEQGKNRINAAASLFVVLLIGVVTWSTGSLSRRVRRIQRQVTDIAKGDFRPTVEVRGHDEVDDLARAVNSMATQLQQMQETIRITERTRLQGQLAGGVAHELRNGIHSARLSLEVFREVCRSLTLPSEDMLQNANEQLEVTETLVQRLLSIGKNQERGEIARPLVDVLDDVVTMVEPICRHQEIHLVTEWDMTDEVVQDAESIRAAIVNLCLNGIEAIGRHGDLSLGLETHHETIALRVRDTGPGPDAALADQLFEPFVTSKPEGIGLGLAQVKQAAESAGGAVAWKRHARWTEFVITLPRQPMGDREEEVLAAVSSAD